MRRHRLLAVGLLNFMLLVACGRSDRVEEAEPCRSDQEPIVSTEQTDTEWDLVAYFQSGVTDKQISDLMTSLNDLPPSGEEIPEYVRIQSDSSADYEMRALRFHFCDDADPAAIARFRTKLTDTGLIERLDPP